MAYISLLSSNRAFILAIAGAAIGLGNIWRFPYMAGEHGGSLFFVLYLLFVLLLGMPVMISELVIGRAGRATPALSIRQLAVLSGGSRHWEKLAWLGTLAALLILSFYCVVSGWALFYFTQSVTGQLSQLSAHQAQNIFRTFLANPFSVISFQLMFIVMTLGVSARNIVSGIEALNNLMMPLLYVILVILVMATSQFSGFPRALSYLFTPDWQQLKWSVALEAMGHAFFTLATGACCLMAYGAYMPDRQSVFKAAGVVIVLDLLVAVLTGLATFSVVFSEGLAPASGPGLMFEPLPVALGKLSGGVWLMPLFFLLLIIATWTSSVNLAEPLVVAIARIGKVSRKMAAMITGGLVWLPGLIPALSFNVFDSVRTRSGKTLFDLFTAFPTDILLPLTGFLILLFAGFVIDRKVLVVQLGIHRKLFQPWQVIVRYISPALVLLIFFWSWLH